MFRVRGITIAFIIAAALFLASPAALSQNATPAQTQASPDLLMMKLNPNKWFYEVDGEVRSIETTEYRLEKKNGQVVETPYNGTKTLYFDRRGFETEAVEGVEGRIVWKYDARGRLAEMVMWLGGAPFARDVYTYDIEHRRVTVESYYFGNDKPLLRAVSIFDERWNETRQETERFGDGKNSQPSREVVVYNLTYDSRGRVVASGIADERGAISYRFTSEFDDSNRIVKSVSYQYDAATATLLNRSVNTYEKGGLLQTYTQYDSRGKLLLQETTTRETDARGNWVTERRVMQLYEEGAPRSYTLIKRRKIIYY